MSDANLQRGPSDKLGQAEALVARMSLEEKAAFCSGRDFWHMEANERLGLASIMLTDGPHGLRKQMGDTDHVGIGNSVPATCFPTACALASSWDRELLREVGVALGEQCAAENVAVLLGPGMNIKRHPLCGRNFEYFSEDPLVSGELAAALIEGIQSQGVGACVKHFAANNQEQGRMFVDAIVDERTLREIYLRGFEIAVRKAQPWTVMCAYNRLNGVYCSEHDWLLNQVLRGDWGFAGAVVTDWGAANDRVRGIAAGLDLEMPASGGVNDRRLVAAVRDGRLPEADLDRAVARNLSLALLGGELSTQPTAVDQGAHHALARRAAGECAVLLKNEGPLLPLAPGAGIAVIGAFAKQPRYQGAGSSQVNPTRLDCAFDAIAAIVGDGASLGYAPGYDPKHSQPDAALIAEAAAAAAEAEVAVVFAGLPGSYESEGFDRSHMALPEQHDRLIAAVCEANPNTVVVLSNGAPVAMPWVAAPKAILEGYLAGQGGGAAMADVLFGRVNPSGKLAETFPLQQADVPADRWFPGTGRQVHYREGLHVGYRYFDTAAAPVLFPFGHGLSYTRFEYGDLELSADAFAQGGELAVSFALTNSGGLAGSEVVQLYAHAAQSSVHRPEQELRAFTKVALAPGETRRVTLMLDDAAFAIYDTDAGKWIVEAGEFEIRLGASSRDIRLRTRLKVQSSQSLSDAARGVGGLDGSDQAFAALLGKPAPPPEPSRPYHLNSSLGEIGETALGRFIRSKVASGFRKRMGVEEGDEATARMFEAMANNMPLRSLALFSGGRLSFTGLAALVALLNHRLLTALRLLLRRSDEGFPD
ncbi:MAG: glycoside hydrolase family 3 C-terminal domain-containing protein [Gammaproteobacteria bacterium]|nr:glycoside hydrolase family 3 C-terminal domain-containing protein [Gammaproteobacteria bacterium]MDE0271965.1 glycoside hydrolase family 3 C-terminal domain-containing protein [Gammaproteobacteria bacterium]